MYASPQHPPMLAPPLMNPDATTDVETSGADVLYDVDPATSLRYRFGIVHTDIVSQNVRKTYAIRLVRFKYEVTSK